MKRTFIFSCIKILVGVALLMTYCEVLVYYVTQMNCAWPTLNPLNEDKTIAKPIEEPLRIMVITDTHLLGSIDGYWVDKVRREWQMYMAFQTAIKLHKPEVVFVLGDLLDEGQYCSEEEFDYNTKRFYDLFKLPEDIDMYIIVGNHDIGFHYRVTTHLNERFNKAFNATAVQLINIRGNNFVLVNSIALEGDDCFLCKPAEAELVRVEKELKCLQNITCQKSNYSRPILMQHYPLYRKSDEECTDFDAAPYPEIMEPFKEKRECLSKEATTQLMEQINPRLALSGHTHHGCTRKLPHPVKDGVEITIPSFNLRNKNNPNYLLGVFAANNYELTKCEMPKESTIIAIYIFGIVLWVVFINWLKNRRKISYNKLLNKKLPFWYIKRGIQQRKQYLKTFSPHFLEKF
ncbi:metallophosphoesterase 1-like [Anthonomus grandis grandis]|uniref:metallophosphoesterase 1-like n=1 Tax=Anthonomus grandis grandis TaxID=2921223 RepID=UPI00216528AA|nr:metallophosphoesterase 1-like [Anthonomus grandis grandis]